ncbi:29662_t:CDS:2, partial [Gigaspora margarita]
KTLNEIYLCGYSRIPIYNGSQNNIKGVLLSKSLIVCNLNEALPLKKFSTNPILTVEASTSLVGILNSFQEDILKELIQEEIYDESDTT